MDDILIATTDDQPLHNQIVLEVLAVLEKESLFLKPEKCKFNQKSVDYLGIVVEDGAIRIDPTKCNGLQEWLEQLSSIKDIQSTLGVFGYQ